MDIIRAQEQSKDLHEQFHHQLDRAQDGFSVIADYYGRGVFNKVLCYCAFSLLSLSDIIETVKIYWLKVFSHFSRMWSYISAF